LSSLQHSRRVAFSADKSTGIGGLSKGEETIGETMIVTRAAQTVRRLASYYGYAGRGTGWPAAMLAGGWPPPSTPQEVPEIR